MNMGMHYTVTNKSYEVRCVVVLMGAVRRRAVLYPPQSGNGCQLILPFDNRPIAKE